MRASKFNDYVVVRVEKGEEIIAALKAAVTAHEITGGFFYGLGVGKDIVLGYFDAHTQSYRKKVFEGEFEFTSVQGNIAQYGKDTAIHCHATIADKNFNAFGGHLFQAVVPATCELVVFPFAKTLMRFDDSVTGLRLLDV